MKRVKILFKEVAKQMKYPTERRVAILKDFVYAEDWLYLDFNSMYGGYRIDIVDAKCGGVNSFSGSGRRNNKEMVAYLEGLLQGLNNTHFTVNL